MKASTKQLCNVSLSPSLFLEHYLNSPKINHNTISFAFEVPFHSSFWKIEMEGYDMLEFYLLPLPIHNKANSRKIHLYTHFHIETNTHPHARTHACT